MKHPIGRHDAWRALDDAVDNGGALVLGMAGVGKTHLLRSHLASAHPVGGRVEYFAACPATQQVRFGALARLLDVPEVETADDLGRMVNDLATALAGDDNPSVMIDDAHLLDPASVAVIHELVVSKRATLWLSARSGEPLPDSIAGLWRSGALARIDLEPLARPEADELAVELLGGPAEEQLLIDLHARAAGVPLYLRELIADGVASGAIDDHAGTHRAKSDLRVGPRMTDLLHDRLDRLEDEERRLVELAALAEPVPVELLSDAEQELVDRLIRRNVLAYLDPDVRSRCRPGHPLLTEAAVGSMPPARRRARLGDLAERVVAAGPGAAGLALRLGEWALSGDVDLDVAILVTAGREALASFEPERAEALARVAVRTQSTAASHHLLGDVLQLSGDAEAAEAELAVANSLATDDERLTRIGHTRSLLHAYNLGDPTQAVAVLQAIIPRLSSPDRRLEVRSGLAVTAALLGRFPEMIEIGNEILATPDIDDDLRSATLGNLCYAQAMLLSLDRFDENLDEAFTLLAAERQGTKPAERDLLWAIRSSVMIERGDFVCGLDDLVAHLRHDRQHGLYHAIATMICSHMLICRGDRSGLGVADYSIHQLERMDPFNTTTLARSAASLAASLAGEPHRAEATIDGLEVGDFPGDPRATAWVGRARAALAADHDRAEAAGIAAGAGREAVDKTQVGWGVLALHDAVRYGHAELTVDRITEEVTGSDAPFMELLAQHAQAAVERNPAALADAGRAFAALGAWLHAGEAFADAARHEGDTATGRRSGAVAFALNQRCTLRSWPLLQTVESPLSERETEIAIAAAGGATSRQIAEESFVSTRTVDNHLGRVYRRLDLGGRAELAELFAPALRPDPMDLDDLREPA